MMKEIRLILLAGALLLAGAPLLLMTTAGFCQSDMNITEQDLARFRESPMEFFFEMESGSAIRAAEILLQEKDLHNGERKDILTTMGMIYLAEGHPRAARASFMECITQDPQAELTGAAKLPPPVVNLFYSLRDSIVLARRIERPLQLNTLAIGDIENNSIIPGPFDLDKFAKGLVHIITTDLSGIDNLTLVDRQRLDVLRREIEMNNNDAIFDPEKRVAFGKLTGAGSFLFGSLMMAEKNNLRIDLRLVETETGEILLAESVDGKAKSGSDLIKLEQKLVVDILAPKIKDLLGGGPEDWDKNLKNQIRRREDEKYLVMVLATGRAVLAEEAGDLAAAATAWAEVVALDPRNEQAAGRTRSLAAYAAYTSKE
ncbi:MAG: CsgG/HfaB family protein [Candidatus Eisenbacteria bacterium]|uniref:CsgG/HfaB family protein n=1 Tax=Eiseniibacteriota bacterium TaxID=2212470 RepID=A0A948W7G6_UNCEI|nr:CsgG/HfaB family protein [Candidatus Eisenbacteria bacterium]MBU1948169.1 CsgG/HfaB family protein [Candidatus Eisenbacteria bacterium]MBU2692215.1 CsgG/HfaB family protein [Candidatus Eisenbacteria bacterium]